MKVVMIYIAVATAVGVFISAVCYSGLLLSVRPDGQPRFVASHRYIWWAASLAWALCILGNLLLTRIDESMSESVYYGCASVLWLIFSGVLLRGYYFALSTAGVTPGSAIAGACLAAAVHLAAYLVVWIGLTAAFFMDL